MRKEIFRRSGLALLAVAASSTLALAGCSSGGAKSSQSGASGASDQVLTIYDGTPTPVVPNFNPYSPTRLLATLGVLYEPLFYYNKAQAQEPTPMLGDTYEWSEDGTQLTVNLKSGVLWSDGEPFTANDVVYTMESDFNSYEGLTSVTASDDTTVLIEFSDPAFTKEFSLLGSTPIIPEHIWKDIEDPDTFANDEDPVVTGPYVFDNSSESAFTLKANPHFREEGKPAVPRLRYLGSGSGQSAEDLIATGAVDWISLFTPDPESLAASGHMSYLVSHVNPNALFTCANADLGCTGPQTDVAVRQAIDVALDRGALNTKAFGGTAGESSATFAIPDRDDEFISPDVPRTSPQEANVEEAKKILEDGGWTLGSGGIYEKDGESLKMKLISIDGWVDYNTAARLISEQLGNVGMSVEASTVALSELVDARNQGKFDMLISGVIGSSIADPWIVYHNYFDTDSTAEVGDMLPTGLQNASRYSNPVVDAAILAASQTNDVAVLKEQYGIIQKEIVNDLPYIPLNISATQTFVNSEDFSGWPTDSDLYAFPPPWEAYASGIILTHVDAK